MESGCLAKAPVSAQGLFKDLGAESWRLFLLDREQGRRCMTRVDNPDEVDTVGERMTLESIESVLLGEGPSAQKIDDALNVVRQRLRILRGGHAPMYSITAFHDEPGLLSQGSMKARHKRSGQETDTESHVNNLVGDSPSMRVVNEAIHRVSDSQATVLLRGESGTGKELVARAIHLEGPRAEKPFVPLHCAAVSDALLESELFGHERGAFTGAVDSRKGRFELAEGGTLFLDEIGDIPLATQVKLLRVLQEKCFERVGGSRPISVDVRVISATHRDLEAMVRLGTFREDLYYRVNVVPIALPPLREREGDIPLLIDYFLERVSRENHRQVRLGRDLLDLMARYHWPGNVRELHNCIERLVVMAGLHSDPITLETIPPPLRGYFADMKQVTGADEICRVPRERPHRENARSLSVSLQEIERDRLLDALRQTGWVQAKTARALGLTPRQVAYKMKKYGFSEKGQN